MRTPTTTRAPRDRCPTSPGQFKPRSPRGLATPRSRGLAATPRPRGLTATARRVQVDLTPQAIEQIAQRVTQLLQPQQQPDLITAGELARRLRVQRPWIYKNRHLLGGRRIGDGPKAPWRFDLDTATQALHRHQAGQHANGGL